jgi:DUF917 family protein
VGGSHVVGVLCAEVGGMNSLEPLMVSAILGLPSVDADGMGRAFPMLQVGLGLGNPYNWASENACLFVCLFVGS